MNLNLLKQNFIAFFNKIFKIFKKYHFIKWLIVVMLSVILIVSTYLTIMVKTAHVKNLQSNLSKSTVIYDNSNHPAGDISVRKGTYVHMNEVSKNIPDAILSTEDRNFYQEHGYSLSGYFRALILFLKNKLLRISTISSGGSTISQQLAKNAYLSQQQTLTRKLKEVFMSIEIENVYSKNQILTLYMNEAYFGNGVYGIEDASEKYFGQSAKNLPLQDAAVLAGLLSSPNNNPIDNPKAAKNRRNLVLQLMSNNGKITQKQANYYKSLPLVTKDALNNENKYKYPYYFDAVINEAVNEYGITESDIMNHYYKIYTTLDPQQQSSFQSDFKNSQLFPKDAEDGTKVEGASIAIDPNTGGVSAVVGGRENPVFRGYNRAIGIRRQPGSTLKPITVYTPALENGYDYNSLLKNEPQSYGPYHYTPKNYNGYYSAKIPMYESLAQSLNVPAVWLLSKIGVDKGYASMIKFNLPVNPKDKNLALALGGMSTGVSPEQLGGAYTTFANDGKISHPFYIKKIVDSRGKVIVNHPSVSAKPIISSNVAKQMTSMMLEVFDNGTASSAKPDGYQVAGKTGSTELDLKENDEATRDKWIVGYTPNIVVVTWEGFDNTNASHHLENLSGVGINTLFKTQMTQILPYIKHKPFNTPNSQTLNKENDSDYMKWWDHFNDNIGKFKNKFQSKSSKVKDKLHEIFD